MDNIQYYCVQCGGQSEIIGLLCTVCRATFKEAPRHVIGRRSDGSLAGMFVSFNYCFYCGKPCDSMKCVKCMNAMFKQSSG